MASGADGVVLETLAEIPNDGRWVVERGLGASASIGLSFSLDGSRYEFHHAAHMRPDLGDVHVITVTPGPRVKRSPSSFPAPADVVREE